MLLLPSSSIFPANDLAADYRMYLPMIGFVACVGLLLDRVRPLYLVPVFLLLVCLKELIPDPVAELMYTGLQTHKRNVKFPTAVHEYFFKELAKVGRKN